MAQMSIKERFKDKINHTFRSLKYRNYRLYFIGQSCSLVGTWIQQLAMPWLVYRLTNSAFLLGFVGFCSTIPTFILMPLAGVLVDRWNKHRILVVTQILSMLQAFILAALFFSGIIEVWHIIVLGICLGCINSFDMPTRQAFVIELVEHKQDLSNAIALNSSMFNGARLIGPSIAGILIALTGEGVCFLLNGISFLFIIFTLLMMRLKPREIVRSAGTGHVIHELKEGFHYVAGFPPIKSIILLLTLVSIMGMPYAVLMPVIAKEVLKGGSHTYGFLVAASGVGALTGALLLASRKSVKGLIRVIPLGAGVFSLALIAFASSRYFPLSLGLMFVVGLGMISQMASSNTVIQTIVEDDKRGRVMSIYSVAFVGTGPLGSLLAGTLAGVLGAPITLAIGGSVCLLGTLAFARRLKQIKQIINPIYVKLGILPAPPAK